MEVEEEVGEPHGGTQIIEDMSETIAKLLPEPEAGHSAIVCINIVRLVTMFLGKVSRYGYRYRVG